MEKTVMYGCIYEDEYPKYKEVIEQQFSHCADKVKKDNLEVATWGFDVLIKDPEKKKIATDFVQECAIKYFPNVPTIDQIKK